MIAAIVSAGGMGIRAGCKVPKQFLTVSDVPILIYTLKNICSVSQIQKIIVVVAEGWQGFVEAYVAQYKLDKVSRIVLGGKTRFESICHGIEALYSMEHTAMHDDDLIGFFDGNRPLIPRSVTEATIIAAEEYGCAVAIEPCYDTMIKCVDHVFLSEIMCRDNIFKGQCPEVFKKDVLDFLMEQCMRKGEVDSPFYAQQISYGRKVAYVKGSSKSFKITTADDIELFKALIASSRDLPRLD